MKRALLWSAWVFVFMAGMISCQDKETPAPADPGNSDVELLVTKAAAEWSRQEVYSDDASLAVTMTNAGIPADFLANETHLEDGGQNGDPDQLYVRNRSFVRCLRGLGLTEEQKPLVKQSLREYKGCTEHAVKRIRQIYNELKEKYHHKYERLWNAYQEGTITEREFRRKVAELREQFRAELRRMHLAEKLDARLAQCLRECFTNLHGILTERQWNAFTDCVKE